MRIRRIRILLLLLCGVPAAPAAGNDSLFLASPGRVLTYESRDGVGSGTGTEIRQTLSLVGDWQDGSAVVRHLVRLKEAPKVLPGQDTLALPEEMRYRIRSGEVIPELAEQLKSTVFLAMDLAAGEVPAEERAEVLRELEKRLRIDGEARGVPKDLSVGAQLPEYGISLRFMVFQLKIDVTDRRVIARESLAVPAGTFDCFVVTERTRMKMMGKKEETVVKTWYARGIGPVRQETSDRRGKLLSVQELVSIAAAGEQPDSL